MTLAKRLLIGSLMLVTVMVAAVVLISGDRLRARLADETERELQREALVVATAWRAGANPEGLADSTGRALGRRVTLIDSSGVVVGDSEFDHAGLRALENHGSRPEVIAARDLGVGKSMRRSSSAGDDEIYVAVSTLPRGFVRVSESTAKFREIVRGAQRDVLIAGLIALIGAVALALAFSRTVSQPIIELRDVARAIASGDLDRRPSLSAPGEVGDLAVALHRMTEQLASRLQAVESEEALLRAVIESLAEGVIAVNPRGVVVRLNQSARRLFSLTASVPFDSDLLPQERLVREALRGAMRGTATEPSEFTLEGRTLSLSARPLPDGGAVIAVMDLTARRRLETIRRDFVANVSHELKTPLTVISGFAETLRDEELPMEDRRQFLSIIESNARRMQRIVDDLLDLSRYESGSWVPNIVSNDLASLVNDVFIATQHKSGGKPLALRFEGPSRQVEADPTALRQVLTNLIENAMRYTSRGSVTVWAADTADGGVSITVKDTGSGIAPEHLPRIFERFYRVDPGRSREEGGTGLGLAIVRHLVEAHGGTVSAESSVGRGTAISVTFPRPA